MREYIHFCLIFIWHSSISDDIASESYLDIHFKYFPRFDFCKKTNHPIHLFLCNYFIQYICFYAMFFFNKNDCKPVQSFNVSISRQYLYYFLRFAFLYCHSSWILSGKNWCLWSSESKTNLKSQIVGHEIVNLFERNWKNKTLMEKFISSNKMFLL